MYQQKMCKEFNGYDGIRSMIKTGRLLGEMNREWAIFTCTNGMAAIKPSTI